MRNPSRRNRNIGSSRQGRGQDNRLVIPFPYSVSKVFYERLGKYEKIIQEIHGREFLFVIEETRQDCSHACSVEDVTRMISFLDPEDFGELQWVIFRQPTRKEETLDPVWGRLIYSFEFEDQYGPAIILEAFNHSKKLKRPRSMDVEERKEFERLKEDGHLFQGTKREFIADLEKAAVRNTQLYRTLPHEFGHYVHYLRSVVQPGNPDEAEEAFEQRYDRYFNLPDQEHEQFAHRYADDWIKRLKKDGKIPF